MFFIFEYNFYEFIFYYLKLILFGFSKYEISYKLMLLM